MGYPDGEPQLFDGDGWGRRPPPGIKSFLFRLNLQMDWILDRIQSIQWSWDPILWAPPNTEIERLTILLEDRRFFQHSGFDFRAIPRVIRQLITFKRVGGVSTIEQQLVRTLLERRERTLRRKTREIILAWVLSYRMSKRDILRTYLATAYMGYRVRGCEEASGLLFSKSSPDLAEAEAALVASLLVYPLPRLVQELARAEGLHPVDDVSVYLSAASRVAPRWAKRIRRRWNYGIALRRKAK